MVSVLSLRDVNKSFGEHEILSNISCDIQAGDIVGLIGKNGCGKTTLMKMILGFTSVSHGQIIFEGDAAYKETGKLRKIGFLLDCQLLEDFSAYDNLILFSKYSNQKQEQLKEHVLNLLKFVGLDNTKKLVKSFSFGMKQRLGLALALLDNPEVLILDEPFVGLDPSGVRILLDYILKIRQEKGVTILISSHQLHEIEEVCDYFLLIQDKKIRRFEALEKKRVKLALTGVTEDLKDRLQPFGKFSDNTFTFVEEQGVLNKVLRAIYDCNGQITSLEMSDSLQDLFRR